HGLLLLLFLLLLGALWRALGGAAGSRWAALAGAVAAFGLWVSVEFLLATGCMFAAFGLLWAAQGGAFARLGAVAATAACLGVVLALGVERPPAELLVVEHDRLSVMHLSALALTGAAGWALGHLR